MCGKSTHWTPTKKDNRRLLGLFNMLRQLIPSAGAQALLLGMRCLDFRLSMQQRESKGMLPTATARGVPSAITGWRKAGPRT